TADVSVSNASLTIVADTAGSSPPQVSPNVILTATQLTGVATGTIRFANLHDDATVFGTPGLQLQLPLGAASTDIQNTPAGVTTEIKTIGGSTGPVRVDATTGRLWLGRTLSEYDFFGHYLISGPDVFAAASVKIGNGNLQGLAGSVALNYFSSIPT